MQTWLLLTIDPDERTYMGHLGYDDDLRRTYRYDSFVPNHTRVAVGDIAIIRAKKYVHGVATIVHIVTAEGQKTRQRCPVCRGTKFKDRKHSVPRFRCECGATFEEYLVETDACTMYSASFGNTYSDLPPGIDIKTLWKQAPRLNKQLAILELNTQATRLLLVNQVRGSTHPDDLPVPLASGFLEGRRTTVMVNRYERDPKAREECLAHYGYACIVCGFRFDKRYGELGVGVIEVHHLEPLSESLGPQQVDPIQDLRPVCPNCHAMIHRRDPPISIEELRAMLR